MARVECEDDDKIGILHELGWMYDTEGGESDDDFGGNQDGLLRRLGWEFNDGEPMVDSRSGKESLDTNLLEVQGVRGGLAGSSMG